jgi:hypothetical protein
MKSNFLPLRALFLLLLTLIFSCQKETDKLFEKGPAKLSVQLIGIQSENEDFSANKSASAITTEMAPDVLEIPINNNLSAYVTLEEENVNKNIQTKLNPSNKYAAKEVSGVTPGVLYGILVYDGDNLVANGHKIFTAGQESLSSTSGFALDGGKTYTFIGYSRNSTTIPTVSNPEKLSTARINDETGDLLYYRHVQTVSTGENNLRITLRHKFTLVTTEVKVGTTYSGKIQEIQTGQFAQSKDKASIKLSDSTITYSTTNKTSNITFPTIASGGVTSVKSNPNLLIAANSTNTVTYSFPSIKVNDAIGVIPATSFNLQAGKKYNLIITLDVPCSVNTMALTNRTSSDGVTNADSLSASYNIVNGNKELTINFTLIDNNFNVFYNNKPLFEARYQTVTITRKKLLGLINWGTWEEVAGTATWSNWTARDADFQNTSTTNIRTVRFSDNSFWQDANIPAIYQLTGTLARPTVKITIHTNGTTTITGKKSVNSDTQIDIVPIASPTIGTTDYPTAPVFNSSAPQTSSDLVYTYETRTIRKAIEFRKTAVLPKNANGNDILRIRQSTRHDNPQAGTSYTDLKATFSPSLKMKCQ